MKHKKISFSILEEIEKKKEEKEIIKIKNLYIKKKQNSEQLKLLTDYQQEYLTKINNELKSGVCIYQWENYNNFIFLLDSIIKDNINLIKKIEILIQENLKKWSDHQKKIKIWQYLYNINNKNILKIKKIQEQLLHDNYTQLKILKKG